MRESYIRDLIKQAEYEVGSKSSMSPGPYEFNRERIEDQNGNEVFYREAADYINTMQALVPSLVAAIDFLLCDRRTRLEAEELRKVLNGDP